ncbi:hypothetical protein BGZ72_003657 [Mortierella alpina]|nr:hypothetical protein BGZ72_003657 [Mortierella alpina]
MPVFSSVKTHVRREVFEAETLAGHVANGIERITAAMARGWIREVGRNFQLSLSGTPLGRLYDVCQALPDNYHDPYIEGWDDEADNDEEEQEGEEEDGDDDEESDDNSGEEVEEDREAEEEREDGEDGEDMEDREDVEEGEDVDEGAPDENLAQVRRKLIMFKIAPLLVLAFSACLADAGSGHVMFYNAWFRQGASASCQFLDYDQCYLIDPKVYNMGLSSAMVLNGDIWSKKFTLTLYSGKSCDQYYDRWSFNNAYSDVTYNIEQFPTLNDNVKSFKLVNFHTSTESGFVRAQEPNVKNVRCTLAG